MLKKIKSSYFIKLIIAFVDEKQKLKIIKYNKSLQKNFDISIINYKLYTGKYIIYESNGFGKEYDGEDDTLLFEGEYLYGERNGKGKEYDDYYYGNLKYEGEYMNGKRNGKGKEYDCDGILKFEGEYLNGERNGKGKEYKYGKLRFKGEYLDGKRNGKGKEYFDDGKLRFEGEYLNDKEWIGTKYDQNGNIIYKLNNNIKWKRKRIFWWW